MRRPRLVYVVTHPVSAYVLLAGQLACMRSWGFDVTVIAAPGPDLERVRRREEVTTVAVPMERAMAPAADARALVQLAAAVHRLRPDIVNASTPKAGLLGMAAARGLSVPVRIYLLRGLRLETATGAARRVLGVTERVAAACAHEVICVSRSLRETYVAGGWAPAHKARVLGDGSSNGIDTVRFAPSRRLREEAAALRAQLGIAPTAPVIGFLGRLSRDKGIGELLDAFDGVRRRHPAARLLVVSSDLADEDADPHVIARLAATPAAVTVPRVDDVRPYLAACDVLGFPSHREGLPNIVLEAAALGLPAVGYRVTGVVDAIDDGVTGALATAGVREELQDALARYVDDPGLCRAHGEAARARAEARFARPIVWRRWGEAYDAWLAAQGLPRPAGL